MAWHGMIGHWGGGKIVQEKFIMITGNLNLYRVTVTVTVVYLYLVLVMLKQSKPLSLSLPLYFFFLSLGKSKSNPNRLPAPVTFPSYRLGATLVKNQEQAHPPSGGSGGANQTTTPSKTKVQVTCLLPDLIMMTSRARATFPIPLIRAKADSDSVNRNRVSAKLVSGVGPPLPMARPKKGEGG